MKKESIIIHLPSLAGGGQERQAVQTADALSDKYHVVIVVNTQSDQIYDTSCEIVDLCLPPSKGGQIGAIIQQLRRSKRLKKLRKELRVKAVLSFGVTANLTNILSAGHGKSVLSLRSYPSVQRSLKNALTYARADFITCNSKEIKDRIVEYYPSCEKKTKVLYNGLDLDSIRKKAKVSVSANFPADFRIIAVGRLTALKGFRHLLLAFSILLKRGVAASLTILGQGEEESSLRKIAQTLNISNRVHFLGFQKNPYQYMRNSDLFILSSIHEGFPNSLLEAMACGLPVVSTDCYSGPLEILGAERIVFQGVKKARYGLLVPVFTDNNSNEPEKDTWLADAMEIMAKDNELRENYQRLSEKRAEDFSLECNQEELFKILSDL